jgi:hypothetical protein
VRDRVGEGSERIRFSSAILPPYARHFKSLEVLIPIRYLKGVSTATRAAPPPPRHSLPWRPWTPEESQVESCKHQNNANIHYQPFPESVSEEQEIYTHYNGYHRRHVKHDS